MLGIDTTSSLGRTTTSRVKRHVPPQPTAAAVFRLPLCNKLTDKDNLAYSFSRLNDAIAKKDRPNMHRIPRDGPRRPSGDSAQSVIVLTTSSRITIGPQMS